MSLRTPLAKARGLGSAKHGTHHFWLQRLTALALVPLSLWFLSALVGMTRVDYATVTSWMSSPPNAILLILFVISLFYHAQLGMQVVIEDYIDKEWQKVANIILIKLLSFVAAVASIFAILKVFTAQ